MLPLSTEAAPSRPRASSCPPIFDQDVMVPKATELHFNSLALQGRPASCPAVPAASEGDLKELVEKLRNFARRLQARDGPLYVKRAVAPPSELERAAPYYQRILTCVTSVHKISIFRNEPGGTSLDEVIVHAIARNLHMRREYRQQATLIMGVLDLGVRFGRVNLVQDQLESLQKFKSQGSKSRGSKASSPTGRDFKDYRDKYYQALNTALELEHLEIAELLLDRVPKQTDPTKDK
jgi:hypothetical protein